MEDHGGRYVQVLRLPGMLHKRRTVKEGVYSKAGDDDREERTGPAVVSAMTPSLGDEGQREAASCDCNGRPSCLLNGMRQDVKKYHPAEADQHHSVEEVG
jgi:hypothetical protein